MTLRVLHVEDSEIDLRVTRDALEPYDIDVDAAKTGEIALAMIEQDPPDVVLLDLNLPGLLGSDVLRWIKAHPVHHTIPVVVLTSSPNPDHVERAYADYAAGFVSKPATRDQLSKLDAFAAAFDAWWEVNETPRRTT